MNHPAHLRLARRLLAQRVGAGPEGARVGEVPAERYTSADRFAREQRALFAKVPLIAAHESELAEPGACLTVEVAGVPLLLLRAPDGTVGAFRNACRHRSTRLVSSEAPCTKKALVCPYHGWTYDLRGRLIHVPHEEAFGAAARSRVALRAAHAVSHLGFVWVGLEPFDVTEHLGPVASDLEALDVSRWIVYRRSVREVRGNWKLIIDAFLDGYHIRHLHRDSVYRFFVDALFEAEPAGRHIRAVTARRALLEIPPAALDGADLRQLVTASYLLFPDTILIVHPDYVSVMNARPTAPDRTLFQHALLIPERPRSEAEEEHWARSFALIDEGVFAREDLFVVEAMQRGIESGANETLLFGALEHAALWFHESVDAALGGGT